MDKFKNNQSGFSTVEAVLVLVIVLLIGVVGFMVYTNHNKITTTDMPTNTKVVDSRQVNLNNVATITFPCATHVSKLKPSHATNTNVQAYGAYCQSPEKSAYKGYLYTAIVEKFPANVGEQQTEFNYCTAKSSYPGAQGHTIYIVTSHNKSISGKAFSVCGLSEDNNMVYETRATAMSENTNVILQIDATPPTDAATLQTAVDNFIDQVRFN